MGIVCEREVTCCAGEELNSNQGTPMRQTQSLKGDSNEPPIFLENAKTGYKDDLRLMASLLRKSGALDQKTIQTYFNDGFFEQYNQGEEG